ncbi:MAG: DUF86 domain-containing protein [Hyphomonadaceae bacterium]|nr:DUF86 domain-containing protein [Hyphomonadaceae bacterium]GIK50847.1 MAG: DUF86 domain-containing protein [Alphaproteobacteria bacterium]
MAKRKARPILEDMLAYAEEARAILGERDGPALRADRIHLLAVTRAVEIVGEAANQLPNEIAQQLPIDLHPAIAMRHRLIHGYDSASADIIAKTVREDFPAFVASLRAILAAPLPDGS